MDKSLSSFPPKKSPIQLVELSLPALLKIIQHGRDSHLNTASGQLVGMDSDGFVEVTDMFAFPSNISDEADNEEYQLEMMKYFRDVNIDHSIIGWYVCLNGDSFVTSSFIDAQLNYQVTIQNSVCIVYDHLKSSRGTLSVKAFRLAEDFVNTISEKKGKAPNVSFDKSILTEIPLEISLSCADRFVLANLLKKGEISPISAVLLPGYENLLIKERAQLATKSLDDYLSETSRLQYHLRNLNKQSHFKHRSEELHHQKMTEPGKLSCLYSSYNINQVINSLMD